MFNVVDLRYLGKPLLLENATEVTLGDLHANPMLLIYFLHRHAAISLSQDEYEQMFALYDRLASMKWLDKARVMPLLERFIALINQLKFLPCSKLFRLLGDELADRGACDLFMIELLKCMKRQGIRYKILLSNHGLCFIDGFIALYNLGNISLHSRMIQISAINSFANFKTLYDWGEINLGYISVLLEEIYYPYLSLVDMAFQEQINTINIYSHAAIGINDLKTLASDYELAWNDEDIYILGQSIQRIIDVFKTQKLPLLLELFKRAARHEFEDKPYFELLHLQQSVFWKFLWNREYNPLTLYRPECYQGYQLKYVYGHDSSHEMNEEPHCVCMDGNLGKFAQNRMTGAWMVIKDSPLKAYSQLVTSFEEYTASRKQIIKTEMQSGIAWGKILPCLGVVAIGFYLKQQRSSRTGFLFFNMMYQQMFNIFDLTPYILPNLTRKP